MTGMTTIFDFGSSLLREDSTFDGPLSRGTGVLIPQFKEGEDMLFSQMTRLCRDKGGDNLT